MPSWLITLFSDPVSLAAITSIVAVLFGEKLAKTVVGVLVNLIAKAKTLAPVDTTTTLTVDPEVTPSSHQDKCYLCLICLAEHADEAGNVALRDKVVDLIPQFVELHFKANKTPAVVPPAV